MTYPTIMPALTLDFQNSQQLDPRVTFSRSSSATYINSAGLIASAADHEARFDHDGNGECLGLLVEESRTNAVLYSEDFQNQWSVGGGGSGGSATNNQILSPDGSNTGAKYAAPATRYLGETTTESGMPNTAVRFNLAAGTFDSIITGSPDSYDIAPAGNGWYRCWFEVSNLTYSIYAKKGELDFIGIQLLNSSVYLYALNSTFNQTSTIDGIYVWGAQLETGSFPTSYIPTTGSTVTRSPDLAQVTTADIYGDEFTIINKPFGVSSGSDTLHLQGYPHIERAVVYNDNLSQEQINTVTNQEDDKFWQWKVLGSSFALSSFTTDGQVTVDWGDGTVEVLTQSEHTFTNGSGYHDVGFRLDSGTYFRPTMTNNATHDQKLISTGPVPNSMTVNCYRAFYGCSNLESIDPSLNLTGDTIQGIVNGCTKLKNFPLADFSTATSMGGHLGGGNRGGFNGCSSITTFPAIDFPLITELWLGWNNCTSMKTFNATWGSGVTNMQQAFSNCSSLESMPFRQTQNVTNFSNTWQNCTSLTSLPLIDTSSGTNFSQAWYGCSSLTDFPANFFDSWTGTPADNCFLSTWVNCSALTATSVENILNSIDTSGQSAPASGVDITIDYNASSGTPNITTAVTNLKSRGWTITLNGVLQ